jgi:hypothetical protein
MRRSKTSKKPISPAQERVIEQLIGGASITSSAESTGVSRQTVHRWFRDDFEFQAQLNSARLNLRIESEDRLFALAAQAIGTVEDALRNGDATAGLSILKGLGLLTGRPQAIGSESPSALRSQAETREFLELI